MGRFSPWLLLVFFLWAQSAAAGVVRVCFNEVLGDSQSGHFSLELLHRVERQTPGLQFQLMPRPWTRCQTEATRGGFDAVVGTSYTPDRAKDLRFPRADDGALDSQRRMFRLGFLLLKRSGSPVRWDGQQFSRLNAPVGVERGHAMAAMLRQRGLRVDDQNVSLDAMLAKLRSGRIAAAVVNEPQWFSMTAWHPDRLQGIERSGPLLMHKDYYLTFSAEFLSAQRPLAEHIWAAISRERDTPAFQRVFSEQQGWQDGQPLPRP